MTLDNKPKKEGDGGDPKKSEAWRLCLVPAPLLHFTHPPWPPPRPHSPSPTCLLCHQFEHSNQSTHAQAQQGESNVIPPNVKFIHRCYTCGGLAVPTSTCACISDDLVLAYVQGTHPSLYVNMYIFSSTSLFLSTETSKKRRTDEPLTETRAALITPPLPHHTPPPP